VSSGLVVATTWHSATPNWHGQLLHFLLRHFPFRNAGNPACRDFHIYLTPKRCFRAAQPMLPNSSHHSLSLTPLPSSATCTRAHWQPTLWSRTLWQPPLRHPTLWQPTLWQPTLWQPTQPFTTAASEVIIRNLHWRDSGLQALQHRGAPSLVVEQTRNFHTPGIRRQIGYLIDLALPNSDSPTRDS